MPYGRVHVENDEDVARAPRDTSKHYYPYVILDNNGYQVSYYTGPSSAGMRNNHGNRQPADAHMHNSTPASGCTSDIDAVSRFPEEADIIPNGEAAMTLVEMWAYVRGRIMR